MKLFLFFLLFIYVNNDIPCGRLKCYESQGICFKNTTCICLSSYDTFPEESDVMCNYKRKSQFIAFLLETFIGFGAGHFYIMNLGMAVTKLIFWLIGYFFFCSIRILSRKRQENDPTTLLLSLGGCLTCVLMCTWQIADVINFGINMYKDGNAIDLEAWGS